MRHLVGTGYLLLALTGLGCPGDDSSATTSLSGPPSSPPDTGAATDATSNGTTNNDTSAANNDSSGGPGSTSTAPGSTSAAGSDTAATTNGNAMCGNGMLDDGELCDGANLGGVTCAELGYMSGTLACDPVTCTYDASMCMNGGPGTGGMVD